MSEFPAQELLKSNGFIKRATRQREQVLGCLSCRWNEAATNDENTGVFGYEIIKCTGNYPGVIYPILHNLEDSGVVTSTREQLDPSEHGRPVRRYYEPVDTDLGNAFKSLLETPVNCGLQKDEL